jgi:glycosyltransferase involved in cell wall biosynthesis
MPALSVILPVYNGGEYLRQSIESVLNQSFRDFEFLILDDCSSDGSREYVQSLKDLRVKIFLNEQNKGLFYNLNYLIRTSVAPLIKLWSQDDIMYPDCLGRIVEFHRANTALGFSYTKTHYIDENGERIFKDKIDNTPPLISTELHSRIAFYTGSIAGNIANVTLSRQALEEVGLFREDMKISGDFDMWVRLARQHYTGFINEPLIQLRDHKKQLSRQEVYYIYHLREDIQVYQFLLGYVSEDGRKAGRKMLRKYKMAFYYTLMVKAFLKGKWRTAGKFLATLSSFDNIFLLTIGFLRNKLFYKRNARIEFN